MSTEDRMKEWVSVLKAACCNTLARSSTTQGVRRKSHISTICSKWRIWLRKRPMAQTPTLLILLHDAIEDQGVTAELIASEFGKHVAT